MEHAILLTVSKGHFSKTLHSIFCFIVHPQTEMRKIIVREHFFYQFAAVKVEENVVYLLVFFSQCDELFQNGTRLNIFFDTVSFCRGRKSIRMFKT